MAFAPPMKTADFDFDLPEDRIALRPADPRDSARLLVVKDGALDDRIIRDLVDGQRNQDWLQVADILEYDLDPMLSGWRSVLTQVAAA